MSVLLLIRIRAGVTAAVATHTEPRHVTCARSQPFQAVARRSRGVRGGRQITRMVLSPAIVPDDVRQPAPVDRHGQRLRLAGSVLSTTSCWTTLEAPQVIVHCALRHGLWIAFAGGAVGAAAGRPHRRPP